MEPTKDARLASSLERTSHAVEVLTMALVILVSPLSVVLSLPFDITPHDWLSIWQQYVFVFIVLAMVIALVGFGAAASYKVRALAIRRSIQKR
ncbi:MAG: hypothetical protein ABSA72_01980 [Nitrososphaerales archaeon]